MRLLSVARYKEVGRAEGYLAVGVRLEAAGFQQRPRALGDTAAWPRGSVTLRLATAAQADLFRGCKLGR